MQRQSIKKGFAVYFDPNKSTSGQRFFNELCQALSAEAAPFEARPAVVLFNVSASVKEILRARLRRQKVLLRIDGLYADALSPEFIARFKRPLRLLFAWAAGKPEPSARITSLANLIDENYRAFARMLLAHRIVYQSKFSQRVHSRYFPRKPYDVIVNGSTYRADKRAPGARDKIHLVTIYDEWKPAKRIHDLVDFVAWARLEKKQPLHLTIVGYTGKTPSCAAPELKEIIENSPFISTTPRFKSFAGEVGQALSSSDLYITFSYRDPCPNAVIEAMAHGLPVVGVASGGMPDIVGDAGILLPADDFAEGFFSAHRFECNFPPIDYSQALDAVLAVHGNRQHFAERVIERFEADLDMSVVANRYATNLRALANA